MFHGQKYWFPVCLQELILQKKGEDHSCNVEKMLWTGIQDLIFHFVLSWKSLPNIKSPVVVHFRTVMKFPRGHAISKNLVRTTKESIKEFIWINLQDKKKCLRSSHPKVSDYDSFINCKSSWNICTISNFINQCKPHANEEAEFDQTDCRG